MEKAKIIKRYQNRKLYDTDASCYVTLDEIAEMIQQGEEMRAAGHDLMSIDTFNYSVFGQTQLVGEHVAYHLHMQRDPALREIIIAVSRRPS